MTFHQIASNRSKMPVKELLTMLWEDEVRKRKPSPFTAYKLNLIRFGALVPRNQSTPGGDNIKSGLF